MNWQLQMENELPEDLKKDIYETKMEYHVYKRNKSIEFEEEFELDDDI